MKKRQFSSCFLLLSSPFVCFDFISCYKKLWKSQKFDLTFDLTWLQIDYNFFPAVDYKIRGWLQDPRLNTDSRLISRKKTSSLYGDVRCDYTNHVINWEIIIIIIKIFGVKTTMNVQKWNSSAIKRI